MKKLTVQLTCNITGDKVRFYEEQYQKKISEYGTEATLQKYFIKQSILVCIKKGIPIKEICEKFGAQYNEDDKDFYNEIISFHMQLLNKGQNTLKESISTQMETDPEVKDFIDKWITKQIV